MSAECVDAVVAFIIISTVYRLKSLLTLLYLPISDQSIPWYCTSGRRTRNTSIAQTASRSDRSGHATVREQSSTPTPCCRTFSRRRWGSGGRKLCNSRLPSASHPLPNCIIMGFLGASVSVQLRNPRVQFSRKLWSDSYRKSFGKRTIVPHNLASQITVE